MIEGKGSLLEIEKAGSGLSFSVFAPVKQKN